LFTWGLQESKYEIPINPKFLLNQLIEHSFFEQIALKHVTPEAQNQSTQPHQNNSN